VDIGDARGLQTLSPASLAKGYAEVDVAYKAPTCLTDSASASSIESFQFVMASCGFTSTTQHTGNAARPWEYSEAQHSIIALDSETASYDAISWHWIGPGDYFDKQCFCKTFTKDPEKESCSGTGLALTKERMWMNATCGPDSLPTNWTNGIKTTAFNYIPTDSWRWPICVNDMPEEVIGLIDQCAANACDVDSDGYCKVTSAVDRACFCRNISYDTCKGPCHVFETRINYIKWLHDLCGRVEGWNGLPEDWRKLAALTPLDTIPWRWSLTDSDNSTQTCASAEWKLASLILVNTGTILAGIFGPRTETTHNYLLLSYQSSWFTMGAAIAALHLFANWINAMLIQSTPGHEDIPIAEMILLWCSMPRSTWLTILLTMLQSSKTAAFPNIIAGCLFAEAILQLLSASPMLTTISYGWQHDFYTSTMTKLDPLPSAKVMYIGALFWFLIVILALILALQVLSDLNTPAPTTNDKQPRPTVTEELATTFNSRWNRWEEKLAQYWVQQSCDSEQTPLTSTSCTSYGTHSDRVFRVVFLKRRMVRLALIAGGSLFLLSVAQWMFWIGFIGVGKDIFCLTRLEVLTGVWVVAAVVGGGVVRRLR
jgi:hypothetical protein